MIHKSIFFKNFLKMSYFKNYKFSILMGFLSVFLFVLFLISGFSRHANYMTSINDLGHFDQAVWGFLEGIPFLNTDTFNTETSRLGVHFDPILAFFVPFYQIYPSAAWLIIAQSLALSMTCWPIFFLAKKILISEKTAFTWAVIFSLNPFILNAGAWDFHPVVIAVPFIALSYLAVEMKRLKWLLICCALILLCKEHFGLLVIGFGLLWGIKYREWKPLVVLVALGLLHIWIVFDIIMPHFSPTGKPIMLSEGQGQLSRYAWLGNSVLGIISEIIKNPFLTLWSVLVQFKGALYLSLLIMPFLGLPLIGIDFLLPGMADLGANMLSANPLPRSIFSYHSATLIPVFTVAAMYGTKRTNASFKKYIPRGLSFFILIFTGFLGWIFFPFFNLPGSFDLWKQKEFYRFHDPKFAAVSNVIKQDFSISVQANVGAHFTHRKKIYTFPNNIDHVDAIILRLESPTDQLQGRPGNVGSLAHHLQMKPSEFIASIDHLVFEEHFKVALWNDPWLVLIKNNDVSDYKDSAMIQKVEKKTKELKSAWKLNETGDQK